MDLEYLKSHWGNVRAGLVATMDRFRDEDLDFKPFPASLTVRQLMLHIAQEEHGEFGYGVIQALPDFPPEYNAQDYPTVGAIQSLLESVHARTLDYLQGSSEEDLRRVIHTPWGADYRLVEMIGHMIEHEIHHRAELSLMLGMLGRIGLDA